METNQETIWYNNSKLLSYNRLFNFLIGNRGHGKTFAFKEWCIRDFIKNKKQFVWVRRYLPEIKLMGAFFDDIESKFENHKFVVRGTKAYIDGEHAGTFIALSVAQKYKSVPFPKVNKIIFDEFIIKKNGMRYLPNEVPEFLDLFSTVARMRDDVRAVFIANNITVANPYFVYFNCYPKAGKRFTTTDNICIENDESQAYKDAVYDTRFGKMIQGTTYGNYAVENEFLLDNNEYVEPMPQGSTYQCSLAFRGRYFSIFFNYMYRIVYVKERKDLRGAMAIAITKDDMQDNTILAKSQALKDTINVIKEMFSLGNVRYDSIKTKSGFYEIMQVLNVK